MGPEISTLIRGGVKNAMEFLNPVACALRREKNFVRSPSIRSENRGHSAIQTRRQTYRGLKREPWPTTRIPPSSLHINGSKHVCTAVLEGGQTRFIMLLKSQITYFLRQGNLWCLG